MIILPQQHVSDDISTLMQMPSALKKSESQVHAYYLAGARNNFFRLEAFCRIYREITSDDFYNEYYQVFKKAEDALGRYDHHYQLLEDVKKYGGKWPSGLLRIFEKNHDSSAIETESWLKKEGWLDPEPLQLVKFSDLLNKSSGMECEKYKSGFGAFLLKAIKKITKEYGEGKINLNHLEDGIHELRRNIRWISIYTKVCSGMIQLSGDEIPDSFPPEYVTRNIMQSGFMKMDKAMKGIKPICIRTAHFAALSWMIDFLGKLKDAGIRSEACIPAFGKAGITDLKKINSYLKDIRFDNISPQEIPSLAKEKLNLFFNEHRILQQIADDIKHSLP